MRETSQPPSSTARDRQRSNGRKPSKRKHPLTPPLARSRELAALQARRTKWRTVKREERAELRAMLGEEFTKQGTADRQRLRLAEAYVYPIVKRDQHGGFQLFRGKTGRWMQRAVSADELQRSLEVSGVGAGELSCEVDYWGALLRLGRGEPLDHLGKRELQGYAISLWVVLAENVVRRFIVPFCEEKVPQALDRGQRGFVREDLWPGMLEAFWTAVDDPGRALGQLAGMSLLPRAVFGKTQTGLPEMVEEGFLKLSGYGTLLSNQILRSRKVPEIYGWSFLRDGADQVAADLCRAIFCDEDYVLERAREQRTNSPYIIGSS